jgi:D-3-phosphoglycerate dehydrogenase
MVLGIVIALSRQLGDRNTEMHANLWNKVSDDCFEVRGKTLGIIGYGHIGSQLSVLAESVGMMVTFFDVLQIMPLGTAKPVSRLEQLLKEADFITLHVPETPETKNMIGEKELALMKPNSYLINASRGTVVDIPALSQALKVGKLAGAFVDVFPWEPEANGKNFVSEILGQKNTILSPHIGGSTEEAQSAIGVEVGNALIRYFNSGSSSAAVNFPEVELRPPAGNAKLARILNVHQNVPGVLRVRFSNCEWLTKAANQQNYFRLQY